MVSGGLERITGTATDSPLPPGSCANLPASYFPLNIQISSITNQGYPPNQTGACGKITQDQLDAESPIVFAHCYTPSGGNWGVELDGEHSDFGSK